jgi:hypothetical protein
MCVTCLCSASSGYHAEYDKGCYQQHTNPLNHRTSSSDISSYHADLHEGHGTAGEWQGHWHGTCECGMALQRNGMGVSWHVWISLWGINRGKRKKTHAMSFLLYILTHKKLPHDDTKINERVQIIKFSKQCYPKHGHHYYKHSLEPNFLISDTIYTHIT